MSDASGGGPTDEPADGQAGDDELLQVAGQDLLAAINDELEDWVAGCVHRWLPADGVEPEVLDEAQRMTRAEVMAPLAALLDADVDRQATNPLTLLRAATRYPSAVLARAGVPAPRRDPHQRRLFPDDHWDLVPTNFGSIGPRTGEAGIRWGAAKAWVHRRRHLGRPGDR